MKKILLTHSYFLRFDPKQWEIMQPYAPLGTIYAAAVLRKNGYEVSLFDPMFSSSAEEIIPSLKSFKPDALVIYDDGFNYLTKMCLTNMREAAFRMSELAKNSGIPVLVSGSDAADHFEKYLDHGAMAVIRGEGEFTLTETLNQYFGGNHDLSAIDGLSFRKNEKTITNRPREVFKDLDEIPLPAWDLVDVETYKQAWLKKNGYFSMNMSTTRGCPFKCNWCAKPIYGNRYNSRSAENVVEEIQLLKKNYNPDHIWFCDDIFGLKPGWVNRFSELVKENKINIRYKIQSRVDLLLQENNIEDLAKSGCDTVWVGAESGSQKILDAMDKGIKVEQIKEATILLKKHGIKPAFFLQFGYPGETEEDIQKTIAMVKELLPDDIGISVSYPLPGTKFYENVKHELKEKANWTDSDELALMFRNTYPSEYYKHLHRYVHKIYRRHQGAELFKNMMQGKLAVSSQNLKRAAGVIYHIPGEYHHRKQMNKIASSSPPNFPSFHDSAATAKAFDEAATDYDKEFTKTQTGQIQRDVVYRYLKSNIDPLVYKNVLEINCGTGEDALWLSLRGHAVIATDASSKMIEIANSKLHSEKETGSVQFIQLPFSKLKELKSQKFDLVFSNFGGLNCASPEEIKIIASEISDLLRPGGRFIAVLMGRSCVIEKFYFTVKGDKQNSNRRKSLLPLKAKVSSHAIDINYYKPEEFASLVKPALSVIAFRPVGLFIPPSYLEKPFTAIPGVSASAKILERFAAIHPGWADYADHYLIDFIKR